jgi:hypothetical protein
MKKLAEAADPKFASPTMPKSVRLFRSTVPGPDTQGNRVKKSCCD